MTNLGNTRVIFVLEPVANHEYNTCHENNWPTQISLARVLLRTDSPKRVQRQLLCLIISYSEYIIKRAGLGWVGGCEQAMTSLQKNMRMYSTTFSAQTQTVQEEGANKERAKQRPPERTLLPASVVQ